MRSKGTLVCKLGTRCSVLALSTGVQSLCAPLQASLLTQVLTDPHSLSLTDTLSHPGGALLYSKATLLCCFISSCLSLTFWKTFLDVLYICIYPCMHHSLTIILTVSTPSFKIKPLFLTCIFPLCTISSSPPTRVFPQCSVLQGEGTSEFLYFTASYSQMSILCRPETADKVTDEGPSHPSM